MNKAGVALIGMLAAGTAFAEAPKATAELLDQGKKAFATSCAACHGEKGAGDGPAAAALNPKPRNFAKDKFKQGTKPEEIFKTIAAGVPGTPMVGFAYLPEKDRWALAYYVLELRKPGSVVKPAKGAKK